MNIKEQIIILSEIGQKDLAIAAGKNRVNKLTKDSGSANKNASELELKVKDLSLTKEEYLKNYRNLEQKLQEERANLRKWEQRADKIKGEREYNALNSEITSLKRSITGIESELSELLTKIKDLEKKVSQTAGAQQENITKAQHAFDEVKDLLQEENEKVAKIVAAKSILIEKLPLPVKTRYLRVYEKMGGIAVSFLNKQNCEVCQRIIPPELYIKVYKHEAIENCPSCQRFLVPLNLDNEVTPE